MLLMVMTKGKRERPKKHVEKESSNRSKKI